MADEETEVISADEDTPEEMSEDALQVLPEDKSQQRVQSSQNIHIFTWIFPCSVPDEKLIQSYELALCFTEC